MSGEGHLAAPRWPRRVRVVDQPVRPEGALVEDDEIGGAIDG